MSIVASLLSIVLFLAFATAGLQRLQYNPLVSASAQRLGFSKGTYQRIGLLEIVAGIGVLAGLAGARGSTLGIINEVSAGVLVLVMGIAVVVHLAKGDSLKEASPALALGVLAALEVVFRLV